MRLIGLILALGAIGWMLYSASGGGNAQSAIPEGYQQSLQKAEGVEQTLKEAEQRVQELEAGKG